MVTYNIEQLEKIFDIAREKRAIETLRNPDDGPSPFRVGLIAVIEKIIEESKPKWHAMSCAIHDKYFESIDYEENSKQCWEIRNVLIKAQNEED